jgi:membrane-associated phospholipid phosphatase
MQAAQNASAVARPSHLPWRTSGVTRPIDSSSALGNTVARRWIFVAAAIFFLCGLAALSLDCSVALWFRQGHGFKYLHQLATISEVFGRGEVVLLVILLMWNLDRARRWAVPGVAAIAWFSGLGADLIKMLIARSRPHDFDLLSNVWTSFGPWLPLGSLGSSGESFPSAHTATAVGLAIALMWLYPAARGVFLVLPVLVAYQRIDSNAHFLSDVFCGAAIGCVVAGIALGAQWLDQQYAERFWGRVGAMVGRSRNSETK